VQGFRRPAQPVQAPAQGQARTAPQEHVPRARQRAAPAPWVSGSPWSTAWPPRRARARPARASRSRRSPRAGGCRPARAAAPPAPAGWAAAACPRPRARCPRGRPARAAGCSPGRPAAAGCPAPAPAPPSCTGALRPAAGAPTVTGSPHRLSCVRETDGVWPRRRLQANKLDPGISKHSAGEQESWAGLVGCGPTAAVVPGGAARLVAAGLHCARQHLSPAAPAAACLHRPGTRA